MSVEIKNCNYCPRKGYPDKGVPDLDYALKHLQTAATWLIVAVFEYEETFYVCGFCLHCMRQGAIMTRRLWTTQDGDQIEISKMDLGHLANTIRYLGTQLEKAKAENNKRRAESLEADLFALQNEFDGREKEITQVQGIASALFKSIK